MPWLHVVRAALLAGCLLLVAGVAAAQERSSQVVPGPRYRPANRLHALLLGTRYRDLWTTPITVPVVDLATFAGGLTPVRTGGFQQTLSLRLEGADGREYNFRSVDKELTPAMPAFTRETFVDWLRQDQTSAQFPTAPIVATPLLDAVGILNPGPRLMVMPDDPRLGEFRETFAGVLGTLEVHPDEGEEGEPSFADAERVAGTDRVLEHLEEDLDHRVDSRAFLKARLMDVFLGDYDRHAGQWRWARYERDGLHWWVPVPEDRDYAFVSYDGLLLSLARQAGIARLIDFRRHYPDLLAMVDNSLALTRYLVSDLTEEEWEEVADELTAALTDEVIRDAAEQMPAEHYALRGEALIETLRARRDRLPEMAEEFYELLATVVEVHGTDDDDRLEIERSGDGGIEVRLYAAGADPPRYRRRLDADDTQEVRVYLEGGDDRAVVRGASGGIEVHVIGGGGDDLLADESAGPTFFYDDRGDNEFVTGRRTQVDEKEWDEAPIAPEDEDDEPEDAEAAGDAEAPAAAVEDAGVEEAEDASDLIPGLERDWGWMSTWLGLVAGWEPHAELVLGAGPRVTRFGYRHAPYRSRGGGRALYAPLAGRVGVEGYADFRRLNSSMHLELLGRVSNLEATVFHGFGNDTPSGETSDLRVWRDHARGVALLHLIDDDRFGLALGPRAEHIAPQEGAPGAVPARDLEPVTRVGGELRARFDTRDHPIFPRRGFLVELEAGAFPEGRAHGSFGRTEVAAAGFFPVPAAILAVRGGVRGAFGDFPFYDAVFLGGSETLRGHHFQRFAGDRAAFAGGSLRIPITRATLLLHGTLGASLFADAGRVWFDGDSPGGWHTALGGGVWFQVPVGAVSVSYARGEEDRLYFRMGLPF